MIDFLKGQLNIGGKNILTASTDELNVLSEK
jgi:hypothetical protein